MIQLPQIKARIDRLRELTVNLGKEVTAQKAAEGLLRPWNGVSTSTAYRTAWRSWTRPASCWWGW